MTQNEETPVTLNLKTRELALLIAAAIALERAVESMKPVPRISQTKTEDELKEWSAKRAEVKVLREKLLSQGLVEMGIVGLVACPSDRPCADT